jgi:hypothetical protein
VIYLGIEIVASIYTARPISFKVPESTASSGVSVSGEFSMAVAREAASAFVSTF